MYRHYNIKVTGHVQKVGMRFMTMQRAYELGIKGFVMNMKEKDQVYIEAEGDDAAMCTFLSWLRKGPPFTDVKNVEFTESEIKNYTSFEISNNNHNIPVD
jgi:acylphosphatase